MMEDKKMNSREFTDLVGISLKKLEKLEKEGKITPEREGRIRYYYNAQVKQYEEAEGKYILGIDVERDKTYVLIYKEQSEDITDTLAYCMFHSIQIDETVIVKNDDILRGLSEVLDIIANPTIEKLYYNGKESVWPIVEEECKKKGIYSVHITEHEKDEDNKKWSIKGLINNVRRKER